MQRRTAWIIAVVLGIVFGWVVAGGVTLWSDDTSEANGATGGGGSAAAEWALGIGVAAVVTVVVGVGLQRVAGRKLLGRPQRLAGGVGEEDATANPAPQPNPEDEARPGSKTTP